MKEWIKEAVNLPKIAREDNLLDKKVMAKKIFGSNLRLTDGKVVWREISVTPDLLLGSEAKSPTFRSAHLRSQIKNGDNSPKNPWAALHAANQNFTENPKSFFMVSLYTQIRTYFTQNY